MDHIRIAAAQYPIELLPSFEAWREKLTDWVEEAARSEAQIAVLPEYAAMELAGIDPERAADLAASLHLVMDYGEAYDAAHAELAARLDIAILAGSRPVRESDGRIVNRARLFLPDGTTGHQDKIVMTRFERERWGVSGGDRINLIHTPFGPLGISICYDVEFPLIARAQAEAGARLILTPSATDSMHGYWRVRLGAQARALENQCFVVQAPTVGMAPWLPAMDENYGGAGVFGPPDNGMPEDGVIALGTEGSPGWVMADIDLSMVPAWRDDGKVLPFRHWPEQHVPFHIVQNGAGTEVLAQLAASAEAEEPGHSIADLADARIA